MSKESKKIYYENNKEKMIEYQKQRYRDLSLIFNQWRKTLKCCRCNENDIACLEFHHCNPDEKELNVVKMVPRGIKSVLNELHKCIVVCSNCHSKIHFYGLKTESDGNLSKSFGEFYQKY